MPATIWQARPPASAIKASTKAVLAFGASVGLVHCGDDGQPRHWTRRRWSVQ